MPSCSSSICVTRAGGGPGMCSNVFTQLLIRQYIKVCGIVDWSYHDMPKALRSAASAMLDSELDRRHTDHTMRLLEEQLVRQHGVLFAGDRTADVVQFPYDESDE